VDKRSLPTASPAATIKPSLKKRSAAFARNITVENERKPAGKDTRPTAAQGRKRNDLRVVVAETIYPVAA